MLTLVASQFAGICCFLGLNVLSFTSDLPDEARREMIRKFNDKSLTVHAMLLSLSMTVTGMNLHAACRLGILCFWYFHPSQVRQAIGRIHRYGQTDVVKWFLLKQSGSWNEFQLLMMLVKEAAFIAARLEAHKVVRGQVREILSHELVWEAWGLLESCDSPGVSLPSYCHCSLSTLSQCSTEPACSFCYTHPSYSI